MLQKYSAIIGKVHSKVKDLGSRVDEMDKAKRNKVRRIKQDYNSKVQFF